jgi:hypothetical protein
MWFGLFRLPLQWIMMLSFLLIVAVLLIFSQKHLAPTVVQTPPSTSTVVQTPPSQSPRQSTTIDLIARNWRPISINADQVVRIISYYGDPQLTQVTVSTSDIVVLDSPLDAANLVKTKGIPLIRLTAPVAPTYVWINPLRVTSISTVPGSGAITLIRFDSGVQHRVREDHQTVKNLVEKPVRPIRSQCSAS